MQNKMIKKVLFVALKYSYGKKERGVALNKGALLDNLIAQGYETRTIWLDEYEKQSLQAVILDAARNWQPHLILFKLFTDQIQLATLEMLRKEGFFTVNWFGDDHWRFHCFTRHYANAFCACITTDKFSVQRYRHIGQDNVIYSQHASFDAGNDYRNVDYQYDVSFVGGVHPFRQWFIKQLARQGIAVSCFGHGWKNGRVSYADLQNIFATSKINLNISNSSQYDVRFLLRHPSAAFQLIRYKKHMSQIKARTFEIPVFGGFELTEYVPTLEDYFNIGHEIACYNNAAEAGLLIRYFLENEKQREAIKIAGVERARQHHTYYHRVSDIMCELNVIYHQFYNE